MNTGIQGFENIKATKNMNGWKITVREKTYVSPFTFPDIKSAKIYGHIRYVYEKWEQEYTRKCRDKEILLFTERQPPAIPTLAGTNERKTK